MVDSCENVQESLELCIAAGKEGLILRNRSGPYEVNARSVHLQKLKRFFDEEFRIVGVSEAKGNDRGTAIFECETPEGERFSVRPGGTRERRREHLETIRVPLQEQDAPPSGFRRGRRTEFQDFLSECVFVTMNK